MFFEAVMFPDASTLNFDDPPTWRSMRFPPNVEVALIANSVPVAEPKKLLAVPANDPSPMFTNAVLVETEIAVVTRFVVPYAVNPPW